jgi:ligand-binding sensor domain-containing protein
LICTNKGFYICSADGKNLRQITNGLGNEEFYSSLALTSGNIFVSSTNGVFISIANYTFSSMNIGFLNQEIFSLSVNPTGTIYAGGIDGIYELASNSSFWQKLNISPTLNNVKTLKIDNNGNIYAGTMEALYISADSGISFQEIFNDLSPVNSITFNTNNNIFTSTEKGFYSQRNNSWIKTGIPFNLFINQLFYAGGAHVYSASADGLYKVNISDSKTELITFSLGLGIIPVYSVTKNSSYLFIATPLGVYRSSNEGINWTRINTGLTSYSNINYLFSIEKNIFCGTKYGLFLSSNDGNSWIQIPSIPITISVNSILKTNNNLIAGTSMGIYVSNDMGESWEPSNTGISRTNISFLDINGSTLMAGNHSTIYQSFNNGNSWSIYDNKFTGLMASMAINLFGEVYIGTTEGVFRSINHEIDWIEWIEFNGELPITDIRTLRLIDNSYLFAGTYGMGIFKTPPLSPKIPTLISPANHSVNQPNNITLIWNAVPNTTLYRVQVSLLPDFSDSNLAFDNISFNNTINVHNLQDLTKYYWRVNSSNDVGESYWSNIWDFTTLYPLPAVPDLITPKYDSVVTSQNVFFKWNKTERASAYDLQISLNPTFDPFLYIYPTGNTEIYINDLELFQTYYWRVRAYNTTGNGNWSLANRFNLDPPTPGIITPLYPQDLAMLDFGWGQNELILKWNSAPKAQKYYLLVSRNFTFEQIVIDDSSITDTFFVFPQLNSASYWWKVQAINDSGEGRWSNTFRFTSSVSSINEVTEILPYSLSQNYPNPFNPETTISFSIPEKDFVSISVFDIHGSQVALLANDFYGQGQHSVKFVPQNIASGIYYYKIQTSKFVDSKKMMYIK